MPCTKIVYAGRHIMRGEGRMPSWNVQRTRERLVDWDLDESYIVPDTQEHMRHPKSISITVGGLSAQGVCSLRTSSVKTATCTFGSCATASPAAPARSQPSSSTTGKCSVAETSRILGHRGGRHILYVQRTE